jgi:hypothetical protein
MPETARNRDPVTRGKKYQQQTTIGDLRKLYGADFAKGCADSEKIADVVQKRPSLMRVIRHRELKRFEQI